MIKWLKRVLIKTHESRQKKPVLFTIYLSVYASWSLILTYWGGNLLINSNHNLTVAGHLITFVLIALFFLIEIAYAYNDKINNNIYKRKLVILENVDSGTNRICEYKFITLKKKIWLIKSGKTTKIPQIISDPCNQLKHILEKMNDCLCEILSQENSYSFNHDEIYIGLYYNFPMENKIWKQTERLTPEKGMDIKDLKNKKTTFSKLLNSNDSLLFFNSKEEAKQKDSYIQDEEDHVDENGELKGSIACRKIIIRDSERLLIQAVLAISTYEKRFIEKNDEETIKNSRYNIDKFILDPFLKRINIELCLLYLSTLHSRR